MLKYFGTRGVPYPVGNSDCYVYDNSDWVATFELISLQDNGATLHIDHFALDTSVRGRRMGEPVLRGFAQLVAAQLPKVNQITFELYRCQPNTDLEKLAKARSELLERIGAQDVVISRPNDRRLCVKGAWPKSRWQLE